MGESHQVSARETATGGLTSIADALQAIGRRTRRLETVRLPLAETLGLTLAEPVATDIDYPPFDKAMMDGFAVRSRDCGGASTRLDIMGALAAGQMAATELGPGQAMRINTGAPLPSGADAVVMIERVTISPNGREMTTTEQPAPGTHVGARAADAAAGQQVLAAGSQLGPAQIAAAAAGGAAEVRVYRRPRMAVLVTGDELVSAAEKPTAGQIRNSNGPCLAALARQAGCEVLDLGVVGDQPVRLRERMEAGLSADLLCLSGGISMGQHDYVPGILREAGVQIEVQKIAIRPGKPTIFGIGPGGQTVFGLPGNPTSAFVCFFVFVRAALAVLQGRSADWPAMFPARLEGQLRAAGARAEWIPAMVTRPTGGASGPWRVEPTRWTGSGDVFGLGRSDALIYRQPGAPACHAGESVSVALTGM